jgi:apolipoprotein D and lipocalin family protein
MGALSMCVVIAGAAATAATDAGTATVARTPAAIEPLASLDVPGYMGIWYQVALFPNRFQRQCASDTTARYRQVAGGIDVVNRCRNADGSIVEATGFARPSESRLVDDRLQPARLEVSFLPRWLRWLPVWGRYWVLLRADDGRYAVVSEPTREYLWVLSRQPTLAASDEHAIRSRLGELGFDLSRWQAHPQSAANGEPQATRPNPPPSTMPAAPLR